MATKSDQYWPHTFQGRPRSLRHKATEKRTRAHTDRPASTRTCPRPESRTNFQVFTPRADSSASTPEWPCANTSKRATADGHSTLAATRGEETATSWGREPEEARSIIRRRFVACVGFLVKPRRKDTRSRTGLVEFLRTRNMSRPVGIMAYAIDRVVARCFLEVNMLRARSCPDP